MRTISLFTMLMLCCCYGKAQSIAPGTLNAAGGTATIAGGTYEWSLGEMTLVSTADAGGIIVTQGILQPTYDVTTGVREWAMSASQLSVFPNPTENVVFLQPHFKPGTSLAYSVLDITGKLLQRQTLTLSTGEERQPIDLSHYASGHYMLQIVAIEGDAQYRNNLKLQKLN